MKDEFSELSKVEFLPTGKRETRYLLGIEENDDRNPVEQFLEMAVGKIQKKKVHSYHKERRTTGGTVDKNFYSSSIQGSTGTFDELSKNLNFNQNPLVVKTKNVRASDKPKMNYVTLLLIC